jgi:hypothetical protein
VTEYGVRGKRGDLEPLVSEDLVYRMQAVRPTRVQHDATAGAPRNSLPCVRGLVVERSYQPGLTKGETRLNRSGA